MRQFYLVNKVGSTYFFDHRTKTLISKIDDIGYEKENTYLNFENSFKKVNEKIPQSTISFSIVFLEGYAGYSKFLAFLRSSNDELRLFYKHSNDESRFIYVAFKSITKSELESNAIQSTLTFEKLSLWYNKRSYLITVRQADRGKVYPYTYPFTYSASYNGEITVENKGEYSAPLLITMSGAVVNPEVDVIKDGVVISRLRLLVSSFDCVINVNANLTEQSMTITENGETRNVYANQDFTCENFLFIETGVYTIRYSPGSSLNNTSCRVSVLEGYGGY